MSPAPAQDVRLVSQTVDDSRTFSASFLSDVWLEWVQPRLHYMRCYMSTLTATIAAIDHTVKAAHKVVMANGKTAFVAVCSVMSSENRILGQFATISFSMEEMRPALEAIYKRHLHLPAAMVCHDTPLLLAPRVGLDAVWWPHEISQRQHKLSSKW